MTLIFTHASRNYKVNSDYGPPFNYLQPVTFIFPLLRSSIFSYRVSISVNFVRKQNYLFDISINNEMPIRRKKYDSVNDSVLF